MSETIPASQPASQKKALYWIVTAFDEDIEKLEGIESFPEYVREIHGGREECPKTLRLHYQGMLVLRRQLRLSTLKKWLPKTHLEICRDVEACKQYCLKALRPWV